jgi:hypothetical protein
VLFRWRSFVPLVILPVVVIAGLSSDSFADGHAALPPYFRALTRFVEILIGAVSSIVVARILFPRRPSA